MHLDSLRRALADSIGQELTPALCASIENRARVIPDHSIDLSLFEPRIAGPYVLHVERFTSVLPELMPLHEVHWLETEKHRHGLALAPNYAAMAADDLAGHLLQFTVRCDHRLVGALRMYVMQSRHSDNLLAEEDTLFIEQAHRTGLLGLKLLRYAEECLALIGVREISANSKLVNGADALMRRMKYEPVAMQFHKILPKAEA